MATDQEQYSVFTPKQAQIIETWRHKHWKPYAYIGLGINRCELIPDQKCKNKKKCNNCKLHMPPKYTHKVKPKLPKRIRHHQAAYIATYRMCPYKIKQIQTHEIEHVCGNFNCWTPSHLQHTFQDGSRAKCVLPWIQNL